MITIRSAEPTPSVREPPYGERVLRWAQSQNRERRAFMNVGYWAALGDDAPALDAAGVYAAQLQLNEEALRLGQLAPGSSDCDVLDVGCGFGATLDVLNERLSASRLVGLNRSRTQLDHAARVLQPRGDNELQLWFADAGALPFADESFSHVIAIECIFHFESRRDFLAEAARVLRPGGRLVLTDFVPPPGRELTAPERAGLTDSGDWPDPQCEYGSSTTLAPEVGLEIEVHRDATAHVLPTFAPLLAREFSQLDAVDRGSAMLGRLLSDSQLMMELVCARRV